MVNARRKAIESLYRGICTVKVSESYKDPVTKITKSREVTKIENQPCKLSYEKQMSSTNTVGPAIIMQSTKLSIAPELDIPPGSKIIVTQNGITTEYTRSGKSPVYRDHQEIALELFGGYA